MEENNFAAYQSGSFAIDISKLVLDGDFFRREDLPAFFHEYCHYIQDITQISSIFGFSLWMRDVVALTHVFSDGIGEEIEIPLSLDEYGQPINKFRKYYNLYCGKPDQVFFIDYTKITNINRDLKLEEVPLAGRDQKLAVNYLNLEGFHTKIHFGLIVLQEIQAYYAQKFVEEQLPDVTFSAPSTSLPSFPYHFGDFLFNSYNIAIDDRSKFILIDFCLDTVQAPSVFLDVLDKLRGKSVTHFGKNKTDIKSIVEECRQASSYSTEEALSDILPDLKMWAADTKRKYLAQALDWYVKNIELAYNFKNMKPEIDGVKMNFDTFFSLSFCLPLNDGLQPMFLTFPAPVYLNNGVFYRNYSRKEENEDREFEKDYEAATTIWSHKMIYNLLSSQTVSEINDHSKCPLYERCNIRKEEDDYTCSRSPWEILYGKEKVECQYGMAAHSFGLWQNRLNIKMER
jgi:hypothetical protein